MKPQRQACVWDLIISLLMFTGCATVYAPPPLTAQYPAHRSSTTDLGKKCETRSTTRPRQGIL